MTRKEEAGRHGSTESSGAESWRSQDTVRANSLSGRRRGAPMKVKTDKQQKYVRPAALASPARRRVRAGSRKKM